MRAQHPGEPGFQSDPPPKVENYQLPPTGYSHALLMTIYQDTHSYLSEYQTGGGCRRSRFQMKQSCCIGSTKEEAYPIHALQHLMKTNLKYSERTLFHKVLCNHFRLDFEENRTH